MLLIDTLTALQLVEDSAQHAVRLLIQMVEIWKEADTACMQEGTCDWTQHCMHAQKRSTAYHLSACEFFCVNPLGVLGVVCSGT